MRWILLLGLVWPVQAWALEICDDLWLTRNLIFDRAGYCFGSVLGKSVFDNEGCTPGVPELAEADQALVNRIRNMETEWECDVDSSQEFLAVPSLGLRVGLVDLPIATGFESSCIGWKGGRLPLRVERDPDGLLSGAARDGDDLAFQFEDVDGWSFVEVLQNGVPAGAGWAKVALSEANCTALAG